MVLDSTARETNYRDSIKRYFVDNLSTVERIPLTFDKALSTPRVQGATAVNRWVSIDWGTLFRGYMSEGVIDIYCCTRQDNEGFKLAQLVDKVMGYLRDTSMTDGMRRITFYKSAANIGDWTVLGGILIHPDIIESPQLDAPDETKYKILTVRLNFASKI